MSLLFTLLSCLVALAASKSSVFFDLRDAEAHFMNFITQHGKQYFSYEEKIQRFKIFVDNLRRANELNQRSEHTEFGITKFSDLTHDEFIKFVSGVPPVSNYTDMGFSCNVITDAQVPNVQAPESLDWRQYNVVTRVKNQGECGSCFTFSAAGNIEGQYAIKHKRLVELSPQQILDCDSGSYGCQGGFMTSAFSSVLRMGGIEMASSYPYVGYQQYCHFNPQRAAVRLTGCTQYLLRSQEKLKQLLYSVGPISIAVKAASFHHYTGGVLRDDACNQNRVNHAILLVGYGVENGVPYWLAKNSWAENFGEKGYVKFQRGEGLDSCGIMNNMLSSAIVM